MAEKEKKFVIGRTYYPFDRNYDPIEVVSRTEKSVKFRNVNNGSEFRMFIKKDNGVEICVDSSVPPRWRDVFTYRADDPVKEG